MVNPYSYSIINGIGNCRSSGNCSRRLPRQDEFRNFCISDETEKVYRKLEEVISIY